MLIKPKIVFAVLLFTLFILAFSIREAVPAKEVLPGFVIGEPVRHGNLTIFPVEIKEGTEDLDLLTMDEATKKEYLEITEVSGGQVNTIAIENVSKRWIFLLAGEIITGAKQNRIIGKDTLLPPKSGKIKETVFCVEHGRWVMESDKFSSTDINSSLNVRQAAKQTENQSEVWSEVANSTKIAGKDNPTGKFDVVYEDEKVQDKMDEYINAFSGFLKENREVSGVVVVVGNEIRGADIFGDRQLFVKLWPKLLKSYSVDALMQGKAKDTKITDDDVESFLAKFKKAKQEKDTSAVAGTRVDFTSKEIVGGVVFDEKGRMIHYVQFPYKEELEVEYQEPYINNQQINAPNNYYNQEDNSPVNQK